MQMENSGLPPELLLQIARAQQGGKFARDMSQQALAPRGTEMLGRIAVRRSPLDAVIRGVTGFMGAKQASEADEQVSGLYNQFAADTKSELDALYNSPDPKAAITRALASRNPKVQAAAAAMQKLQQERLKGFTDAVSKYNAPEAARIIQSGDMPQGGPPGIVPPQVSQVATPDGRQVPMVVNTGEAGRQTGTLQAPGTTVVNQLPGRVAENTLSTQEAELKKRKEDFDVLRDNFYATQRAVEALDRGAQAGPGAGLEQALRQIYYFFGGNPANLTETTNLSQALGQQILAHARKLAPVTAVDIKKLEDILGSAGTTPEALGEALSILAADSVKGMYDFNAYLDTQEGLLSTVKDPATQDALRLSFSGQKIGREPPKQLFGNPKFQGAVLTRLQERGFDTKNFANPFEPGMAGDARFQIRGAGTGFPAAQRNNPPVPDKKSGPVRFEDLSPEDQAKVLEQLRKRGGK